MGSPAAGPQMGPVAGAARHSGGHGRGRGRPHGGGGNSVSRFLAPHTGRQAAHVAGAEANTEYGPEIRQLREKAAGQKARGRDLGQWYAQLAADYQGAEDAGASALQSVESTTSQQLAEAGQRSSTDQARLANEDEAFAKLTGGPVDSASLAKIAQAGSAAERARVAAAAPVASEAASYVGRVAGEKTAARLRGIESRDEEDEQRKKTLSELGGVRKEKGQATVAAKAKIQEADRGYEAELAKLRLARREAKTAEESAAAEAALAQLKASHEAQQDAIANRQSQERIGISAKNAATSARSQRATARNYRLTRKGKGKLSTAEKLSRGEHAADAMSTAKALLGIKVPKTAKEWSQFEAALIEKLGSSYGAEAAAAVAKIRQRQKQKARKSYTRRLRKGKILSGF